MADLAYTLKEASAICKIGLSKLHELINDGYLVARKCGKKTLILHSDLELFLLGLEHRSHKETTAQRLQQQQTASEIFEDDIARRAGPGQQAARSE